MTRADTRPVAVLGAGGHAKVIVAALRAAGRDVVGCFVRDEAEVGRTVLGVPVLPEDSIPEHASKVLAAGDGRLRQRLAARMQGPWATVVHPSAVVDPSVHLAPGVMVCAGAILQPDVRVEAHAIVNTAAHVDHDCVVGPFVHLAPGCHVAGDVTIEEGAFIGTGSTIVPARRIGAWATVGAGAVVVHDVPAAVTVIGVPARPRATKS